MPALKETLNKYFDRLRTNGKWLIGISEKVISGYLAKQRSTKPKKALQSLTHREQEILKLIAEGYRKKDIGELLCISVNTVEKHRENIMYKMGLHNVSGLTSFAIENGLILKV